MPRRPDDLTGRADVLLAEAIDGEVRVNLGDARTGEGWGQGVSMWGTPGFIAMPDAPDDAGAAEVLYLVDGPRKYVVGARDNRTASKAGAIVYGDRLIYSSCDARFLLKKADNGITLYTANETDNGTAMAISLSGKKGEAIVTVSGSVFHMDKDSITLVGGGCSIELRNGTISICGKHLAANTGGGNLGTLGPAPPPPGLGSVLAGPMGQTGVASAKWTVALSLLLIWHFASLLWDAARSA